MAIVEDITNEESNVEGSISIEQLIDDVRKLTEELKVPSELVPGFMASQDENALTRYRSKASRILENVKDKVELPIWKEVEPETQLKLMENIIRLNGEEDDWSSVEIRSKIQSITPHLSPSIPLLILPTLRPYFTSHPSLSTTSRALSRPIGGELDSKIDLHDIQPFKEPLAWGITNLLSFSASKLTSEEIEKYIGLILPPTLVLMDDWEPFYRLKGAKILDKWIDKLDNLIMKRMGIDKLLINSLIHTISLSSNPPLKGILKITLKLINKCTTKESKDRIELYSDIIEKGIIQSWIYSPSGIEGRQVLININDMLVEMLEVMGTGIIRWLKSIIPNLLQPIQYPPTNLVLPHYQSNLQCLLCVIKTIRKTGRIENWRGQILNILSRLWVQLKERQGIVSFDDEGEEGISENHNDLENEIQSLVKQIFEELAEQIPSIKQDEFQRLLELSPGIFGDLISNV